MSELTPCNFCSLKRMKEHYGEFNIVINDNEKHGGKDVRHNETGKLIAWFMELPKECAC
jgi:hypothetical protein